MSGEGAGVRAGDAGERPAGAAARVPAATEVLDGLPVGVVVTDAGGVIVEVNAAFTAINGYTAAEVVGRKMNVIKSNRHAADFYAEMWRDLMSVGSWRGEIWNRRKTGELYPALLAITALRDAAGAVRNYVGTLQDISQAKESEERVRYLAYHDVLTGLPNRVLFKDRIALAIGNAQREQHKLMVVFLDLDGFKQINDTLGHAVGDLLLVEVARRLRANIRVEDTVARLGGDEFLILLPRVRDEQSVLLVIDKIVRSMAEPHQVQGSEVTVTASMGVSVYPNDGASFEELLKAADIAMYRAKQRGKRGYVVFSQEMTGAVQRRADLERRLRAAVEERRITLCFQPCYDLRSRRVVSVEALARWREEGESTPPAEFIAVAEESGLIVQLGEWVLEEACRRTRDWIDRGAPELAVSVNVSPKQLLQRDFSARVEAALARSGLPPSRLILEITENSFVHNLREIAGTLTYLSSAGVRFALDDFGTGYSSLFYLKRLPIRLLMIGRSFVRDLETSGDSRVIVQTILSMAEVLDVGVVAEGVETRFQEDFIREHGRARDLQGQGNLFSPPLPPEEIERLILPG